MLNNINKHISVYVKLLCSWEWREAREDLNYFFHLSSVPRLNMCQIIAGPFSLRIQPMGSLGLVSSQLVGPNQISSVIP